MEKAFSLKYCLHDTMETVLFISMFAYNFSVTFNEFPHLKQWTNQFTIAWPMLPFL